MTVGESIVNWVYGYNGFQNMDIVNTDQLGSDSDSYGIYKQPDKTIIPFVDGSQDVTERYYFLTRKGSKANATRIHNQSWMEQFEAWVCDQSKAQNLPTLDGNKECYGVAVAVSAYMSEAEADTATYQISVEIKYTQK